MRKFKEDLLSDLRLEQLIEEAVIELRNAKKHGAVISSSGGIDSEVIYHIAKTYNILPDGIFFNKVVESSANNKRLKEQRKHFSNIFEAKTESYKSITGRLGFPIANKNFSQICYRLKNSEPSLNNIKDKFRIVTGVSPNNIFSTKIVSKRFSLDLKFWYLALNYPIQEKCCTILKKSPAKKVDKPMIIGIMKSDSPERRTAINQTYHGKFFPLKNWTKNDIFMYIHKFEVIHSKDYQDRKLKNNRKIEIVGATNTGCVACHFGHTVGYFIRVDGKKIKTNKFDRMKLEKPKQHNQIMKMKHNSGVTFEEVIKVWEDSKSGKYLRESIALRNEYISKIKALMIEDGIENYDEGALELLESFIV